MKTFLKWSVAIGFSLLAHAGTAALFQPEREAITEQIAGGEAMEVTLLGNAFEDAVQAGNPDEIVDPLETPPEEMEPIEEVAPVEAAVSTQTPTDVQPVEADVVLPAEEIMPYTVATAEVTATASPVEIVVPEEKPEIRPEPERIEKPKEKPPAEKKIERKKPVKKKAGEDGNAVASAKKGQADGVADAQASTASGKKGNMNQQAGNAAASNCRESSLQAQPCFPLSEFGQARRSDRHGPGSFHGFGERIGVGCRYRQKRRLPDSGSGGARGGAASCPLSQDTGRGRAQQLGVYHSACF